MAAWRRASQCVAAAVHRGVAATAGTTKRLASSAAHEAAAAPIATHAVRLGATLPNAAPLRSVAPVTEAAVGSVAELGSGGAQLLQLFASCKAVTVITGAGISTSSGIPDYRSPGRPAYTPLQHADFMAKEAVRRRYWSRSFVGYPRMATAAPNAAHAALAGLQAAGRVKTIVTQNVDRLHQASGATGVIELHGTIHNVECLTCGATSPRAQLQERMAVHNAQWVATYTPLASPRPDGDVELPAEAYGTFVMPTCPACGSDHLKPCVVFFGGNVPPAVTAAATAAIDAADGLLVVGTTLATWSAFRLVRRFVESVRPRLHPPTAPRLAVINYGATRADAFADACLPVHASAALTALAAELRVPPLPFKH